MRSRLRRCTYILATTVTLCFGVAPQLPAQANQRSAVPKVFIEAFRSTDTVGRKFAVELREALARSVSPVRLVVMSTAEIDAFRSSGEPDDFMGGAWPWTDVRMAGRSYRATCVIDLLVTSSRSGVTVAVARLRAPFQGEPETLEPVVAPTIKNAVAVLARRLASDSTLFATP